MSRPDLFLTADNPTAPLLRAIAQALAIDRPLAVFDLETTGVNPEFDRVVEITVARVVPGSLDCHAMHTLVDPLMIIPLEASAIHGITDERVFGAPTFAEISGLVLPLLMGADLLGYNHKRFDARMIAAEFRRLGQPDPCAGARFVDPQQVFFQRERRDLSSALQFFCQASHEGAHGTTPDCVATMRVLLGQLERYPDLPRSVAGLDALGRDPSFIDADGKFIWRGGKPCVGFGKYQGVALADVDRSFLSWMLSKDFSDEAKAIARAALRGVYPAPPVATPVEAVA